MEKQKKSWIAPLLVALIVIVACGATWLATSHYYAGKLCDAIARGYRPDTTAMARDMGLDEYNTLVQAVENYNNGRMEQAIEGFEQLYYAAQTLEEKMEYGTPLAYAYVKARKIGKAKNLLVKLLSVDPDNAELEQLYESIQGIYSL